MTISIPLTLMASESIAHLAFGLEGYQLRAHSGSRNNIIAKYTHNYLYNYVSIYCTLLCRYTLIIYWLIINPYNDHLSVDLIAHLAEHWHVRGQSSDLNFSGLPLTTTLYLGKDHILKIHFNLLFKHKNFMYTNHIIYICRSLQCVHRFSPIVCS